MICLNFVQSSLLYTFTFDGAESKGGVSFCYRYHYNILTTNYLMFICCLRTDMAGLAPEGSQFDARQFDTKMNEL